MSMMRMIALAAAAALIGLPAAASQPTPGRTEFRIYMNGQPVGRHVVAVAPTAGGVEADVSIDMKGRVGPFGFTYSHRCEERWAGDALQSLACTDRENNRAQAARATRSGAGIAIDGTAFKGAAPGGIDPSSWWRADTVRQTQLIDTRTGALMPVRSTRIGTETIDVGGERIQATRWRIRASQDVDIWYDQAGRWVKMNFRLRGQQFEYRKVTPIASAPRA
jgi:hypothetical protein